MSEKTPLQIGREAGKIYSAHTHPAEPGGQGFDIKQLERQRDFALDDIDNAHGSLAEINVSKEDIDVGLLGRVVTDKLNFVDDHSTRIGELERVSELAVNEGRMHHEANQAAYHDLAVIEAHMGGVAIKVEQPLELGQKVDVRQGDDTETR